ncbi:MAG: 16S rRNA (cytidine(1402)-2'-O)-methyltransferase, partial [Burkholderiales bacterium]|nr:16S rRNA (cytidine(1402)-2'-O)-methyltransferase [Burkholderiales bacterium]
MLYICATPIGNLKDISLRALKILSHADIILCEDTRNSRFLLNTHNIQFKKLIALHGHNENEVAEKVIQWLQSDLTIVQISDAGTPGISDPGARLCERVIQAGLKVSPIPGACAYISLLSVSGIQTPSLFYGFLPSTKIKRTKVLEQWVKSEYAVAIYEAPHRILECMEDIISCLGANRTIIMGREMTKQFETIKKMQALDLLQFIKTDNNQQKGEFVLLIGPSRQEKSNTINNEQIKALKLLS